jgi:predicted enzyme related to lactoylglutathione lyase
MSKMNSVVHFEMPYDDRERMAKFYQNAFGWQTQMLGEEMGNYVKATTTERNESGPIRPGAINGGFFRRNPDWPAQHPSLVLSVDDIEAAIRRVTEAGGKILGEPMEIPSVGRYISFFDTEGNRVSMLQPIQVSERKTPVKGKIAALVADGFQEEEYFLPKVALQRAGFKVEALSTEREPIEIYSFFSPTGTLDIDKVVADAKVDDYVGV